MQLDCQFTYVWRRENKSEKEIEETQSGKIYRVDTINGSCGK